MVTLARMGFDVHAFDYESQGRSEGSPRFFIPSFQNLVDDAVLFAVTHVAELAQPDARLFLFGESMGGAVGLLASQYIRVSGAVLLAPMCKLGEGMKPGPMLTAIFSGLARITPTTYMPGPPPPPSYTPRTVPCPNYHDLSMWEQQDLDPLRVQQFPPLLGTALSILNTTLRIGATMEDYRSPLLLMGGLQDEVCAPSAVKELYTRSRSADKQLLQYKGIGHCILAEDQTGVVERDLKAWLLTRCRGGGGGGNSAGGGAGDLCAPPTRWRQTPLPPTALATMLPSGGGLGAILCDRLLFGVGRYEGLLSRRLAEARVETRIRSAVAR